MSALPRNTIVSPLGHSANVTMWLHAKGKTLSLVQAGDTAIKLAAEDSSVPLGPARVEIVVDGVSHFTEVVIASRRAQSRWLDLESKPRSAVKPAETWGRA